MILFSALPGLEVTRLRKGGRDAYDLPPELRCATEPALPCRHCLRHIPVGRDYLTLAWRPFPALQPYAETGPIFLCAACERAPDSGALPDILSSPDYILRGYSADHRIVYGTGQVVATSGLTQRAAELLSDAAVAYLHVRSARNTCYQLRIDRAGQPLSREASRRP